MRWIAILLLVLLAGCGSTTTPPVVTPNPGTGYQVTVVVTDAKNSAIPKATVTLGAERSAVTNTAGFVEFSAPNGMYRLTVAADAYIEFTVMLVVDRHIHQDVRLVRQ